MESESEDEGQRGAYLENIYIDDWLTWQNELDEDQTEAEDAELQSMFRHADLVQDPRDVHEINEAVRSIEVFLAQQWASEYLSTPSVIEVGVEGCLAACHGELGGDMIPGMSWSLPLEKMTL